MMDVLARRCLLYLYLLWEQLDCAKQWLTVYTRGIDGEERERKEKEKDGVFCLAKLSCVLRGSV